MNGASGGPKNGLKVHSFTPVPHPDSNLNIGSGLSNLLVTTSITSVLKKEDGDQGTQVATPPIISFPWKAATPRK